MASIIEPKATGYYVVKTVHGSFRVQHLRAGINCAEFIEEIVEGPFEDLVRNGKVMLSAQRLANQKMAEHIAELSAPVKEP